VEEVVVDLAVKIEDLAGAVDDHGSGGVAFEQQLLSQCGQPPAVQETRRSTRHEGRDGSVTTGNRTLSRRTGPTRR